jgi:hypothetical protein
LDCSSHVPLKNEKCAESLPDKGKKIKELSNGKRDIVMGVF